MSEMVFVDQPPPEIGELVYQWTNNGPSGPRPPPLWIKLAPIYLLAMLGFVLGLVGVFVVGGTMQHYHHEFRAEWFLYSLGLGALAGALAGIPLSLRPTKILTLYVGKDGSAQISAGKIQLLSFADVEDIRSFVSETNYKGIKTSAREYHVRFKTGKERLWYVEPATTHPDDPRFAEETLRVFRERQPA
jgi:hypothetical protein